MGIAFPQLASRVADVQPRSNLQVYGQLAVASIITAARANLQWFFLLVVLT